MRAVAVSRPGWGLMIGAATPAPIRHGELVISFVERGVRRAPAGLNRRLSRGDHRDTDETAAAKPTSGARSASPAARTRCTTAIPTSSMSCCRSGRRSSASAYAALGLLRDDLRRHDGGLPDSRRACSPERIGAPSCWRSAPRSPGFGYCLAGVERGLCHAARGAVRRRARRQHAASAGLRAGRARLCRTALAHGARHLQFRRRHRQDDGARHAASLLLLVMAVASGARAARRASALSRRRRSFCSRRASRRSTTTAPAKQQGGAAARQPTQSRVRGFPLLLSIGDDRQRDAHGLPACSCRSC